MTADATGSDPDPGRTPKGGLLDLIEAVGNRLPDPSTLFLLGTVLVMVLSAIAVATGWSVEQQLPQQVMVTEIGPDGTEITRPQVDAEGNTIVEWVPTGATFEAKSLLTGDGLYWAIRSVVDNFMGFAPLGVVLVGMLGIGVAERTGLMAVLLKGFMLLVPNTLLTPAMVFIGIMSSIATDAGYVVLPPLAALLYKSVGRSPLAGLAAVFAGVSAGFNANLLVTGLDPMLAELSTQGAIVLDATYAVAATCNLWFMIASTFIITGTGWAISSLFVERRLSRKSPEEGGPVPAHEIDASEREITDVEKRGLRVAGLVAAVMIAIVFACILIPGAPLHDTSIPDPAAPAGSGATILVDRLDVPVEEAPPGAIVHDGVVWEKRFPPFWRWVNAIVPILFLMFIVPGIAFGLATGKLRSDKDVAKLLVESMAAMGPIIVLAFFAAQFIEHFKYSGLDKMLALAGGQALGQAGLPTWLLLVAFILVTMVFNLFVGSMSAKYTMFAPIFIPMFMMVSISPELTQAAYRIGDSVTNIITPLNAYLVIILVFMKQYVPKAGMGTLISTMLPYTIGFTIVWMIMIVAWQLLGIPLGPGDTGPLTYDVTQLSAAAGG